MTKDEISDILENIARLLELKGENPFKIRAYTNGARALDTLTEDFDKIVARDGLGEVEGIGKALVEKITTLARTGKLEYYEELREQFPPDIFTLFDVPGLGAKKIKALYDQLGVHSLTKLERVCRDGQVAALPGFGEKTAENILKGLDQLKKSAGQFRLGDISGLAESLLDDLRSHPRVSLVQVAGSYRRKKPIVRDLDFIVSTRHPKIVLEDFVGHHLVDSVLAHGDTKASVILKNGIQCDIRVVKSEEYPFALVYFTGSKEHNVRLRSRALDRGWSLNEYRFSVAEGRELKEPIPEVYTEADVYRALGLSFVEPELREDRGEIAAAEAGELPQLIEWQNLRGTFHCHTHASDGRASLEEMAHAAEDLGLQYLGIADHSKSSVQANGLDEKRLLEQVARIRELNQTFDGFRIFAGTECDIRKDGSLDFSDEILAQLDYVVVSVHVAFSLSEVEMTDRIIKAISNPYVTMMGHLTGRLLLTREPYKVNVPAVIEAAAATGTIIELNANPRRLDMDWQWWPLAKEKGVRCSINPDAHTTAGLQDLIFGIGSARKGWLTRHDVVNTLPLGQIEKELARKRK
ncbi:MAG: histidinol-phosphatase [Verrucomicrobia bacterium 61-8]|nr:DNA polymerase/3'-5' exonuclease PolX [Verrucomicrobiota bacterium]OJU98218.1 MAG: histidinol-phosphatase [Verrucomicrobia bacterium 61-8]